MGRSRASVPLALLLLLATRPAGADVADFLGRPIAQVRIDIEGEPAREPRLLDIIVTRAGRPLSMIDVRESVTHLISLGRFENVVVHASDGAGGVELRYDLSPIHPVDRITFAGDVNAPGVDTGDLRAAVVERYGAAPSLGRGADMARLMEAELAARGYLRARVAPRAVVAHYPDRSTIVFEIAAGPRAQIGAIDVVGASGSARTQLLNRLDLAPGKPYERDAIDERVERYIADRRGGGYYEARLIVAPRPLEDDRVVNLTVTAEPGPRVTVAFTGDPLPRDRHDELAPIAQEGSADEDLLEDSSNRIVEYLRGQGYRDAAAGHRRAESNGELRITFEVRRGRLYRVATMEVSGNRSVPLDQLRPLLGLQAGQPFRASRLDADVAAVEALYRRSGFASVSVQSGLDVVASPAGTSEVPVTVRVIVTENAQSVVGSVTFAGNTILADSALEAGLGLRPGIPFFVTQMALDRDAIQLKYADAGFHGATVDASPTFSSDGGRADVTFRIQEGPQLRVDHVLIVGNIRTSSETIQRELQVKSGDALGLSAVNESQRRLAALGLFRRVRLTQLAHGDETTRDLLVSVEEAPVTSVGFGPGLEVVPMTRTGSDGVARPTIEVAPRGFFEVGRRNLFGKNRSLNLFTSLSLQSSKSSADVADTDVSPARTASAFGFAEFRVLGTFREPRVFGLEADAVLTGTTEQQARTSFNFARRAFTADLIRRVTRHISVTGNYQIQRTELFDEVIDEEDRLLIDRLFPQVRLSSFSSSVVRDTRDDLFDPAAGHYVSALAQVAARRIGSEVGLLKTYLTAQLFRTVPRTRRVVFAGSARVGMASGFARDVTRTDADGRPILDETGEPVVDQLRDLPASERFFAGGDTTVRGFALDQLGTADIFDEDGFPLGGNAVVILNAEMRVPVFGGVDAVGFFDTGNVFARTSRMDLGEMRSALGFGVRYRSPVGPIRLDIGFKLNPRDIVPGYREPVRAFHISLGQAF